MDKKRFQNQLKLKQYKVGILKTVSIWEKLNLSTCSPIPKTLNQQTLRHQQHGNMKIHLAAQHGQEGQFSQSNSFQTRNTEKNNTDKRCVFTVSEK